MNNILRHIFEGIRFFKGSLALDTDTEFTIDDSLDYFGDKTFSNPVPRSRREDKRNMGRDLQRLRGDYRIAINAYKDQVLNG